MVSHSQFGTRQPMRIAAIFAATLAAPTAAQVTSRVSVSDSGAQGIDNSGGYGYSITPDGRFVAFHSDAPLAPNDACCGGDVYVRDRQNGTTQRVSLNSSGGVGGGPTNSRAAISADGRYVAFESLATNLAPTDANGWTDVFLRDRSTGTTTQLSLDPSGGLGDGHSSFPHISADGRYVAFYSHASNLVAGDTNGVSDVFVRDCQAGTTERVSVDSGGAQGDGHCGFFYGGVALSADGRHVAFQSLSTNLVPGDTNGVSDVFVHDRQTGTTERVSVDSGEAQGNGDTGHDGLAISDDGRYVTFGSLASNLVAGDTNGVADVFVRDRQDSTTERVNVAAGGAQANGASGPSSITPDGRFVGFSSLASNLVVGDTNLERDTFLRDRQNGTTERVSVSSSGAQQNNDSQGPAITPDGRYLLFSSSASNLVPGDTNTERDLFLRDRTGGTSFTSLCGPGAGGVIACPCSNPPSGPGRGCNNSSNTGGAILSASGGTSISSDSLVFTTSGQRPTALSIVAQWVGGHATGVEFGMGVRCTSGTLKRLFAKSASGGSITAPDYGAGDPTVTARSAAKGDTIVAGQSRWYIVYYRDNTVLGGCPPLTNFNATQTGQVAWSP
ncbi:MAG: TolB family protein [Planctomycetota bacterium]